MMFYFIATVGVLTIATAVFKRQELVCEVGSDSDTDGVNKPVVCVESTGLDLGPLGGAI